MIQGKSYTLHIGNNLDILPTLPDNSVDSIVTDPPYELGFMGKKWDNSGIAYSVELWTQCLRVLKPGGHLLSFGGTRTWHRVAVAIEDAGFEVRDSIAWMYGSGFPKSLDVSKAIDKGAPRVGMFQEFAADFAHQRNKKGLSQKEVSKYFPSKRGGLTGCVWNWENGISIPTIEQWKVLQTILTLSEQWLPLIERQEAERNVVGERRQRGSQGGIVAFNTADSETELITAPSTPEGKQWQGWGTALKPAFEPIVVARKPLIGTVAENVLTHGTGALNIDGSRILTTDKWNPLTPKANDSIGTFKTNDRIIKQHEAGRWPANVILDEYSAELLDEQSGISRDGTATNRNRTGKKPNEIYAGGWGNLNEDVGYGGSGGASRFFYVAKASKRDRNEGLEELPIRRPDDRTETGMGTFAEKGVQPAQNFHPTVKPTDLMRYLIKLVTPPGGVVLDPFTGSGSTGKAAILEGFRFIGCELTEDYIPIIEGRLQHAEAMAAEAEAKKDEALF
jgi:DNA modification methylase